jgi:ABC-type glycerol-3-phosphate transport system permease component
MIERAAAYAGGALKYGVLILYLCIVVFPMVWVFYTSAKSTQEIYKNPFGLPRAITRPSAQNLASVRTNYGKAWVESGFSRYFGNSVKVVLISLAGILALGAMAAYVLARFEFRGRTLVYYLFLSGLIIPMQLILIPLFFQYSDMEQAGRSLLQPLARALGYDTAVVTLHDTQIGLILIYIAASLPFTVFVLTSFFRTLPEELREAALIDGASEFSVFRTVMIPLAKPGLVTVAIFNFLGLWNEYLFALVFINSDHLKTLPLGLASISMQAQYKSDFGLMFAGLVIVMLPTLIVYMLLQERLTKGVTVGALKG